MPYTPLGGGWRGEIWGRDRIAFSSLVGGISDAEFVIDGVGSIRSFTYDGTGQQGWSLGGDGIIMATFLQAPAGGDLVLDVDDDQSVYLRAGGVSGVQIQVSGINHPTTPGDIAFYRDSIGSAILAWDESDAQWEFGGAVSLESQRLYLRTADTDSYLSTGPAVDTLSAVLGGTELLRLVEATTDEVLIGARLGSLTDADTWIDLGFTTLDEMRLVVGNVELMRLAEAASDVVTIGPSSAVSLRIGSNGGFLGNGDRQSATISGGVITATAGYMEVDNESGAATDDLDTINGLSEGDELKITSTAGGRDPTLKDGTGNLLLAGDCTLTLPMDTIHLLCRPDGSLLELSRSDNG